MRNSLPFCLHRREDGKYIALNRHYKPVGSIDASRWYDYDTWPEAYDLMVTPEQAVAISHNGSSDTERIFFYDDGCPPWSSDANELAYSHRRSMFALLDGVPDRRDTPDSFVRMIPDARIVMRIAPELLTHQASRRNRQSTKRSAIRL